MTLNDAIDQLQALKTRFGNIDVFLQSEKMQLGSSEIQEEIKSISERYIGESTKPYVLIVGENEFVV
ncbi:hypothetical protein [Fangia hongkongensis]|uniref:hypothetical protein n=1 Tax=Fangia hongkongensis TaxID=270495 RepID=UPI00035E6D8E|nr:hypothetical protein [Fangia hongkongensis]MBK2124459.1 hypothetical protein [Fangia hongkongensis]